MIIDVSIFKPLLDLGYREYSFYHPKYIFSNSFDTHISFNFSEFTVDKYWFDCSEPFTFSELDACYSILKPFKE